MKCIAQEGEDDPARFIFVEEDDSEECTLLDTRTNEKWTLPTGNAARSGYWVPFDGDEEEVAALLEKAEQQ